ncbi:hypothetical protein NQ318_013065 [Aromia moschata]|uniref:Uncharacterized protein n=1 Tax=Aromia moschata TaxID=1265417 RepID=A0AAV8XEE8_9CUCU|nr:hypothetical protein NQ318_013065 [Aromia moschata]
MVCCGDMGAGVDIGLDCNLLGCATRRWDVKTTQNQERNIMGYRESEVCLVIKSEELDIKEEEDECDGEGLKKAEDIEKTTEPLKKLPVQKTMMEEILQRTSKSLRMKTKTLSNILEFPKNSKKRRQALSLLRNDTNFNLFIQGIVRPKEQRFKNFVKDDEYIPCAYCKVLIVRHYLKRHVKSYTVLAAKEIQIRGKINHVSRSHTLTACMTDPTNVIFQLNVKEQKDLLIVHFGNSYLKKKNKREGLRYACSNRMRELSRLLISVRKMMENENMALKDILHPKKSGVLDTIRLLSRKQWLEDVKNFRKLVECRWNIELASLANKDLQEKRTYKDLVQCVLSLLIVFNRRRIGDVQFLKLSEYQCDTNHTFTDFDSLLTNTEKILTKYNEKYKRVLIPVEKGQEP